MKCWKKSLLFIASLTAIATYASDVDLSRPVPKIALKTPQQFGNGGVDQVVDFTTWRSTVLVNDVIGSVDQGLFCGGGKPLTYSKKFDDWLSSSLGRKYRQEAVRLGIAVPEGATSVFDEKAGKGAAFQLGATLLELDYRICADRDDAKGDAYAKIKWELFSSRRQKVVYTTIVESSHSSSSKVPGNKFDADFMHAIVNNLFGDPKLAQIIQSGGVVDEEPSKAAFALLQLDVSRTVSGGVAKAVEALQAAVVTVESGVGSGSAFYISREGYLLTNQHVVAGATFVRVKLSDGRNMVGEVLRVDKARDVALLRTDPVTLSPLALRPEEGRAGEEVYALGSPFGKVLSGTLTRGVLSARRILEGVPYLQSDVAINPGNSGGPMIDSEGRVLGIAQLQSNAQGINLFIPIEDAVDRLGLAVWPKKVTGK